MARKVIRVNPAQQVRRARRAKRAKRATQAQQALKATHALKAPLALLAHQVKTVQTVLMASLHSSVIMEIGISERLTLEDLRAAKRVPQAKKEKRATLEPPARLAQRAI